MTKAEKAEQLKEIAATEGITTWQAAVRNSSLAGGLEVLAQDEAKSGSPRGSGSTAPMVAISGGLRLPHHLDAL